MDALTGFLRSGHLGPLQPGMTRAEILSLLGPPEGHSKDKPAEQTLKYGDLQLGLSGGLLKLIGLYPTQQGLSLPAALAAVEIRAGESRAEFEARTAGAGLTFKVDAVVTFEEQLGLRSRGGVLVLFAKDGLESLQAEHQEGRT